MSLKRIVLAVAVFYTCAITSAAQQAKIESKYDRFKDQTLVSTTPLQISGGKFDGVHISAAYSCQGNTQSCQPEKVLLMITVVLKGGLTYDLPGELIVLADGQRYPLGNMTNYGAQALLPQWNIYGTSLGILVPYDTYSKISKASKIEIKLDVFEFELTDEQRPVLRDLISQTSSSVAPSAISSAPKAQQVEWTFPKQGMETKTVNGKIAYKLGKDCYGVRDEYNGRPIAIIFLPATIETLIDNVNASQKNAIPDKAKFLTALAVSVAIVQPEGKVAEYIGMFKFEGDDAYAYKTRNGLNVVAIASKDFRYVVIALPSQ